MTTQDDNEEPFDQRAYTAACVSTALKRYRRERSIRRKSGTIMAFIAAAVPWSSYVVPWLPKFAGSSIVAWYVGMFVVVLYGQTEQRLRTMQIRLAWMHDLLHHIAGDSAEEQSELLMELVAEVGDVEPDPKLYGRAR